MIIIMIIIIIGGGGVKNANQKKSVLQATGIVLIRATTMPSLDIQFGREKKTKNKKLKKPDNPVRTIAVRDA